MESADRLRCQAVLSSIRKGDTMASSARALDERTFVGFARQHVFVTVFGLVVPLVVFLCFIGYPDRLHDLSELLRMERHGAAEEVRRLRQLRLPVRDKYFYIALVNNVKWLVVSLVFPGRRSDS